MPLKSIKPGADIVVTGVEKEGRRILLRASNGKTKSRPFSEIEVILKALNSEGITHVETVLAGSGSSRNQPETIFANLPYIDYTFIDRKKHLVLRDEHCHQLGALKELDLLEAKHIVDNFKTRQTSLPMQIIVTTELRETTKALVALGGDLTALSPEVYSIAVQGRLIWVIKNGTLSCSSEGAYALLPKAPSANAYAIGTIQGIKIFEEPNTHVFSCQSD